MSGLAKFVDMLRGHYADGCTARIGAEYAAAIVAEYDALKARAESARCEPVEAGGCAPPVIASAPAGSCSANGFGHMFGPHGPAGRRQCEYCGEAQQPADPVGTILREVCELEPGDPDKSDTVIVKFDDLHRILARNIVPQPQQPVEAVGTVMRVPDDQDFMGNAQIGWHREIPPVGTKLYTAPLRSINMEQFRKPLEALRQKYVDVRDTLIPGHSYRATIDPEIANLDRLLGLIGGGGERANG